ncbi:MAG: asparagine synthetase B [Halomonas sp.]|nr:asparagine synthetase B [Halomonas sp.]TVP44561.1 MAG: asparagine synthetase B [Halomonas sp.]
MSAIAGLIHLDSSAVDRDTLHRMQMLLTPYGRDAQHSWHQQNAGLSRTLLRTTPEDSLDQQPLWRGSDKLAVVFDGRIDNREELCEKLGIEPAQAVQLADSELVYRACLQWDSDAPKHLLGDFAVACWQPQRQRLWLARDPMGVRPLFWYKRDNLFAFATMPKALFAIPGLTKAICEEQLHDYLCLLPMTGPSSFFQDVYRVEPGHTLVLDEGEVSVQRYHRFDPNRKIHFDTDEEYVEALREHLNRAIACRLRAVGPIATHLSSGKDSTTVTACAAQLLNQRQQPLIAYTAVPRENFNGPVPTGRHADEGPAARSVAERFDNVKHVLISTDGTSPLDNLHETTEMLDRAPLNACNVAWAAAIRKDAASRGVKALLCGDRGNVSISYDGMPYLPYLLRTGSWRTLRQVYKSMKRHYPTMTWRQMVKFAAAPLIPRSVWQAFEKYRDRAWELNNHSAISPTFSSNVNTRKRARDLDVDLTYQPPADGRKYRIDILNLNDTGEYNAAANIDGVEYRDPTGDVRLMEFCLAVPETQYLGDGQPQWLLKRLMNGILPDEILHAKTRGLQSADWYEQTERALPELRLELERLKAHGSAGDYLDLEELEKTLDEWPDSGWASPDVERRYRYKLLRGLSVGTFIRYADESNE